MTSTAYDDQFTPATQTILRVNVIESQQQIHDLQTRLAAAIERAEKTEEKLTTARDDMQSWIDSRNGWMERAGAAEAELAKLREQKPVAWCDPVEFNDDPWSFQGFRRRTSNYPTMALYAAPVHAPAVLSVSSNVLEMLDGVFADTATGQKYLSEARALLQSAPQASAVQLVDGSDDYYDYLGALVEQHPAGVMRRNTDDKAPAVPDDTAILDWLEMQRVDVASVVGHRPQYGFLSVGASGKSDLRSKVRALLQSAEAQASDKLQLTPAPTHPADRNAGEVRHD